MSNTQHTTGPWLNDGEAVSAFPDPENSKTYIAPICTMDVDWTPETVAANARLIACAPELLDALRELEESTDWTWDNPYRVKARAVIAKATGGDE